MFLEEKELPTLKCFTPQNWSGNVFETFKFHFGKPYFHPFVAEVDKYLAGCVFGINNENSGWISSLVVLPQYQGQGIATRLVQHEIEFLQSIGCLKLSAFAASQASIAVFSKFGFATLCTYTLLKRERSLSDRLLTRLLRNYGISFYKLTPPYLRDQTTWKPTPHVRRIESNDFPTLLDIDQKVTGEGREKFIKQFFSNGWVFQKGPGESVTGFYLQGEGFNPIVALDQEAGLELLCFKIGQGAQNVCVPSSNQAAINFLLENGFSVSETQPRMSFGSDIDWRPEGIFNRGGGTG